MEARQYSKRDSLPEVESIERRCLRCNKRFMAEGRLNRICKRCAKVFDQHYSHLGDGYTYPNLGWDKRPGSGRRRTNLGTDFKSVPITSRDQR